MQWNLIYGWKDFDLKRGSNPGQLDQKYLWRTTEKRRFHFFLFIFQEGDKVNNK